MNNLLCLIEFFYLFLNFFMVNSGLVHNVNTNVSRQTKFISYDKGQLTALIKLKIEPHSGAKSPVIKSSKIDRDHSGMTTKKNAIKGITKQRSELQRKKTTKRIAKRSVFEIDNGESSTEANLEMSTNGLSRLEDQCSKHGGCNDKPFWYCSCDELCEMYQDCCQQFNLTRKTKPIYSCVGLTPSKQNIWGVQTIATCPRNYKNKSVNQECLQGNIEEAGPPVFDTFISSVLYRNKYCAICNGNTNSFPLNISFHQLKLESSDFEEITNITADELKQMLFKKGTYRIQIPDYIQPRYCITGQIKNEDEICQQYLNPVVKISDYTLHRNSFCTNDSHEQICLGDLISLYFSPRNDDTPPLKLSILFSFKTIESKMTDDCENWNQETANKCNNLPLFTNAPFELTYFLHSPKNASEKEIIQAALLTLYVKDVINFTKIMKPVTIEVNDNNTLVKITTGGIILKTAFGNETRRIKQSLIEQEITIFERENQDIRFVTIIGRNVTASNFRVLRRTNSLGVISLKIYLRDFDTFLPTIYYNEFCGNVHFIVKHMSNDTLYVDSLSCLATRTHIIQPMPVLSILTYMSCSFSSVCLITMIIVNRRRHLHVEIPFSNLENLSISIILSNVLFMVGIGPAATNYNKVTCYAIGVILHYLWLTVFSFASFAVFYIVTTLFQLRARHIGSRENTFRKRRWITCKGLGIPFLFVGSALAVDKYGPLYFSPGYGKSVCFPTQYPGNLIFFTGPVLSAVIVNVFCLVYIIFKVHATKLSKGIVEQSPTFSGAKIFLRILAMTCIFWITGIAAVYFDSEWLEYVFTVLCGSQGIIIAAANMTTRRLSCRSREASISLDLYSN